MIKAVINAVLGTLIAATWAAFLAFCWVLVFDTSAVGSEDQRTAAVFMAFLSAIFITIVLAALMPDASRVKRRVD